MREIRSRHHIAEGPLHDRQPEVGPIHVRAHAVDHRRSPHALHLPRIRVRHPELSRRIPLEHRLVLRRVHQSRIGPQSVWLVVADPHERRRRYRRCLGHRRPLHRNEHRHQSLRIPKPLKFWIESRQHRPIANLLDPPRLRVRRVQIGPAREVCVKSDPLTIRRPNRRPQSGPLWRVHRHPSPRAQGSNDERGPPPRDQTSCPVSLKIDLQAAQVVIRPPHVR